MRLTCCRAWAYRKLFRSNRKASWIVDDSRSAGDQPLIRKARMQGDFLLKISKPIFLCPFVDLWDDNDRGSWEMNRITKDTVQTHQLRGRMRRYFCLNASRRAVLAQSQNPSGKPKGNSKAANALVRKCLPGNRRLLLQKYFLKLGIWASPSLSKEEHAVHRKTSLHGRNRLRVLCTVYNHWAVFGGCGLEKWGGNGLEWTRVLLKAFGPFWTLELE